MKFFYTCLAVLGALFSGCRSSSTGDIPAVTPFELDKFCGKWYEIARLPNFFEKGLSGVTAFYAPIPGTPYIRVINRGVTSNGEIKSISGRARFAGAGDTGELEVSFFYPFYSKYRVIYLDEAYRTAVVCGGKRNYLWILSREPFLAEAELQRLTGFICDAGFEVEKLEFSGTKNGGSASDAAAAVEAISADQ